MNVVTSAQVRTGALEPAMDAIAAQDKARRLLHHPDTPQPDSIVELLVALGDMVVQLVQLNGIGLHAEQQVTGWADRLVAQLHDIERNGPAGQTLSGRRLAQMLLEPLEVLGDPGRPDEYQEARAVVHDLFARVPADSLFRDAVTYHLGAKRTRTMRRAHQSWTERKPGRA